MFNVILTNILTNLAVQLPVIIVLIVGIIISLVKWKKTPKPSLIAFLGFLFLFLNLIIGSAGSTLPFILQSSLDMKYAQIGIILTIFNVLLNLGRAIAYVLLIVAVFTARKSKNDGVPSKQDEPVIHN